MCVNENVLVKLICCVRLSFLISNPVRSLLCLMRNENCIPTYIGLSPVLYFCTCNIDRMYNETWLNFMIVYYNSSCTVNMFWLYIGHKHSPSFINHWHTIEFHATNSQLQEKQLFVQHCYFLNVIYKSGKFCDNYMQVQIDPSRELQFLLLVVVVLVVLSFSIQPKFRIIEVKFTFLTVVHYNACHCS